MKKNKFNLPFSLGNTLGFNGCNVYDTNGEYICGFSLPLHETIQQIRKESSLRFKKELELADFIVRACNSHAALLTACKLAVQNFERSNVSGNFLGDDDHEAWTALTSAIVEAEKEATTPKTSKE